MKKHNLQRMAKWCNGEDSPFNSFEVKFNITDQDADRFDIGDSFPKAFHIDSFGANADTSLDNSFRSDCDICFKYIGERQQYNREVQSDLKTEYGISIKIFKDFEGKKYCVTVLLYAPVKWDDYSDFDFNRCLLKAFGIIIDKTHWTGWTSNRSDVSLYELTRHGWDPNDPGHLSSKSVEKFFHLDEQNQKAEDLLNPIIQSPAFWDNINGVLLQMLHENLYHDADLLGDRNNP